MKNNMKTSRLITLGLFVAILFLSACQRSASDELIALSQKENTQTLTAESFSMGTESIASSAPGACNPNAYIVTLESHTSVAGNWEWVWSVQNSNPGNGNNGTIQDLSHWGMQLGTCVNFSHIVAAAYSIDGNSWTGFTPSYNIDPSQTCQTTPVLKFDYGTTGASKTYYRLTVNYNYSIGQSLGYYKSGNRTGCCTFGFTGIGCDEGEGPR
jgi:hypothetical protein